MARTAGAQFAHEDLSRADVDEAPSPVWRAALLRRLAEPELEGGGEVAGAPDAVRAATRSLCQPLETPTLHGNHQRIIGQTSR